MEKRAILAFGLSALLLFGYIWVQEQYFSPPPAPPKTETRDVTAPPAKPTPAPGPAAPAPGAPTSPTAPGRPVVPGAEAAPGPRPPQQTAEVPTALYHAVVSSEGGKLQEWTLDYRGRKP